MMQNKKIVNNLNINDLKKQMVELAQNLEFEKAAEIRDKIKVFEKKQLGINE